MTTLFQRRHYKWFAAVAADAQLSNQQIRVITAALSDDNHRFNLERFLKALDNHRTPYKTNDVMQWRGAFTTHNLK